MSQTGEGLEGVVHFRAYHGAAVPCRNYELSEVHGPGIVRIEDAIACIIYVTRAHGKEDRRGVVKEIYVYMTAHVRHA